MYTFLPGRLPVWDFQYKHHCCSPHALRPTDCQSSIEADLVERNVTLLDTKRGWGHKNACLSLQLWASATLSPIVSNGSLIWNKWSLGRCRPCFTTGGQPSSEYRRTFGDMRLECNADPCWKTEDGAISVNKILVQCNLRLHAVRTNIQVCFIIASWLSRDRFSEVEWTLLEKKT